jgi:hypothetical protein
MQKWYLSPTNRLQCWQFHSRSRSFSLEIFTFTAGNDKSQAAHKCSATSSNFFSRADRTARCCKNVVTWDSKEAEDELRVWGSGEKRTMLDELRTRITATVTGTAKAPARYVQTSMSE